MTNLFKYTALLCWGILSSVLCYGQVGKNGAPVSWQLDYINLQPVWESLDEIDVSALMAEDDESVYNKSVPARFASAQYVDFSTINSGRWINLSNGDRVWKLGIHSDQAYSLSVIFNKLYLPVGSKLYIFNDAESDFIGPYTSVNNTSGTEHLSTMPLPTGDIILEYFEPYAQRGNGVIQLGSVAIGYKSLDYFNQHTDASCQEVLNATNAERDYGQTPHAVFQMIVDSGQRLANGTMLNNTRRDGKVYLITSSDVMMGDPSEWVFTQALNDDCGDFLTCWSVALMGGVEKASSNGISLIELSDEPREGFDSFLSGWDKNLPTSDQFTMLGYSSAKPQSIAVKTGELESAQWNGIHAFAVSSYDIGMTYAGAIGSPLINSNGDLVAILVGGSATCDNEENDYYIALGSCWEAVKSYLDPLGLNTTRIEGMEAIQKGDDSGTSQTALRIFPNPADTWIYINSLYDNPANRIEFYNASGQLIGLTNGQSPSISVEDLASGYYCIRVVRDDGIEVYPLAVK